MRKALENALALAKRLIPNDDLGKSQKSRNALKTQIATEIQGSNSHSLRAVDSRSSLRAPREPPSSRYVTPCHL